MGNVTIGQKAVSGPGGEASPTPPSRPPHLGAHAGTPPPTDPPDSGVGPPTCSWEGVLSSLLPPWGGGAGVGVGSPGLGNNSFQSRPGEERQEVCLKLNT